MYELDKIAAEAHHVIVDSEGMETQHATVTPDQLGQAQNHYRVITTEQKEKARAHIKKSNSLYGGGLSPGSYVGDIAREAESGISKKRMQELQLTLLLLQSLSQRR